MKELEKQFLDVVIDEPYCGFYFEHSNGDEYKGEIVSADFAKKLIEERDAEHSRYRKTWCDLDRIIDERATSFAMLSKTIGGVNLTEYQPEVDLEINSRIEQIKFENESLKELLLYIVNRFDKHMKEEDEENAPLNFVVTSIPNLYWLRKAKKILNIKNEAI